MSKKNTDQEKQAAVSLLVDAGIDFNNAVELVEKKASELEKTAVANLVAGYMGAKKGDKVGGTILGGGIGGALGAAAGGALGAINPGLGAAGALTGLVAGGYYGGKAYSAMKHSGEKKAAVDMLIERGVDFDTAVSLVNEKAAQFA
jgi:hypothetical protein